MARAGATAGAGFEAAAVGVAPMLGAAELPVLICHIVSASAAAGLAVSAARGGFAVAYVVCR